MQGRGDRCTQVKQTVETKVRFMRGNLKYAVGRGITDGLARPDIFIAKALNDFGARGVAIAQYSIRSGGRADGLYDVGRKGRVCIGEIVPVPWHRHTGKFPVPRGRVLAF